MHLATGTGRTGRPRDKRVDAAILGAALELFVESGLAGTTFEGIAARSGVSRTAIYRRWRTRGDLIVAALAHLRGGAEHGLADWTARPVAEVVAIFADLAASTLADPWSVRLLRRIVALDDHHPIRESYWRQIVEPRRRAFSAMIRSARERGQLPPGPDPEALLDRISGALLYRALLHPEPPTTIEARTYVQELLADLGLASR
jgi:AcrR family transcriptional regulator